MEAPAKTANNPTAINTVLMDVTLVFISRPAVSIRRSVSASNSKAVLHGGKNQVRIVVIVSAISLLAVPEESVFQADTHRLADFTIDRRGDAVLFRSGAVREPVGGIVHVIVGAIVEVLRLNV